MARPLVATPTLKGKDALNFLRENERLEKLDPKSEEAKRRNAFLKECVRVFEKTRPIEL